MEDFEFFEEQVDQAFDGVATVFVNLGNEEIEITSMSEIPVDKMLEFVMADNNDKLLLMFSLVELCMVNPEDFKKVQVLNTKRFMKFVDDWTTKSSDEAMGNPIDE
jgi:hypothetical protein